MNNKGLSFTQAEIIKSILASYPYSFLVFGSRVKGTYKPYSDLDLCYQEAIPDVIIAEIEDKFEKSDLPFKVDLVSWKRCSVEFQKLIKRESILLDAFIMQ